jgi:hypothetical protein
MAAATPAMMHSANPRRNHAGGFLSVAPASSGYRDERGGGDGPWGGRAGSHRDDGAVRGGRCGNVHLVSVRSIALVLWLREDVGDEALGLAREQRSGDDGNGLTKSPSGKFMLDCRAFAASGGLMRAGEMPKHCG